MAARTPARIAALGAGAVLAAVALPAAAQPSSPEELAAAVALPAVVHVEVTWHGWVRDLKTGERFGGTKGYTVGVSCTGAVISPDGYVATASHCVHTGPDGGSGALFDAAIADLAKVGRVGEVAKARAALAEHGVAEGRNDLDLVDRQIVVRLGEDRAPATVVNLVAPDDGDVAVLRIPRDQLPTLAIRSDPPPVGTPVLAIGYPGSVQDGENPEPSTKNGQISAHRTQQGHPFYEFSAAATHGMSGGPVVDTQGDLVGLISQGTPGETQSFNLASAASTLRDVLRAKDITVAPGAHDRNYRRALVHYFDGDYDGAVTFFDAVLAAAPANTQAAAYRQLAVDKGGAAGSGGGPLLVVFLAISAGIAVLAGALGLTTLRRRRTALATVDTPPHGIPLPEPVAVAEPEAATPSPEPPTTVAEPPTAEPPATAAPEPAAVWPPRGPESPTEPVSEVPTVVGPAAASGSAPSVPPRPDPPG